VRKPVIINHSNHAFAHLVTVFLKPIFSKNHLIFIKNRLTETIRRGIYASVQPHGTIGRWIFSSVRRTEHSGGGFIVPFGRTEHSGGGFILPFGRTEKCGGKCWNPAGARKYKSVAQKPRAGYILGKINVLKHSSCRQGKILFDERPCNFVFKRVSVKIKFQNIYYPVPKW